MISFPNCKINLGLNVICKRDDGYHDLQTIFYPIGLKDALEIVEAAEMSLRISGLSVSGDLDDNLCVKAYQLIKADFPELPSVAIHLHKAIPTGAGLGGGSADGAFMLTLLNKKFDLKLSGEQLISYALRLGSDCPFFIINTPCFATGRGENLTPVAVELSAHRIVVINPQIHVTTKEAFSEISPKATTDLSTIISQPVEAWKETLVNDFEKTVFSRFPVIAKLKGDLYEAGAIYASMTGSGSTVFGVFKSNINVKKHFLSSGYRLANHEEPTLYYFEFDAKNNFFS